MSGASTTFEGAITGARQNIKESAKYVKLLVENAKKKSFEAPADSAEIIANLMLTYRHLEDAAMRLGKVLQANDGGVSIYDK